MKAEPEASSTTAEHAGVLLERASHLESRRAELIATVNAARGEMLGKAYAQIAIGKLTRLMAKQAGDATRMAATWQMALSSAGGDVPEALATVLLYFFDELNAQAGDMANRARDAFRDGSSALRATEEEIAWLAEHGPVASIGATAGDLPSDGSPDRKGATEAA